MTGVGTTLQNLNLQSEIEVESSSREQSSSAAINQSPTAAGGSRGNTNSKQLVSKDKKKLLCIVGGAKSKKELKVFDISTRKCKKVLKLPFKYKRAWAVAVGDKIICFGDSWAATDQAHSITTTPYGFEVNKIRNMNVRRRAAAAAVLDGRVYISGGFKAAAGSTYRDPFSSCEVYSVADDTWSRIPDMKTGKQQHSAVSWNGQIVVIGGFDGGQALSSVECFDPHTREWRELAPLNIARSSLAVVVIGDVIYAFGGWDENHKTLKTVEKYSNGTWKTVAPMNLARQYHAACVIDGRIFVVGGVGADGSLTSVETYDPAEDKWTMFCQLDKEYYCNHSVVAI